MDSYTLLGSLVLPDRIVPDGVLEVENGVIKYAGRACGTEIPHGARRVDIHCHAGGKFYCHDNPRAVAAHHLAHGTTSMLFTMYRRIPIADMLKHTIEIKELLPELRNVLGVHLEGPYLITVRASEWKLPFGKRSICPSAKRGSSVNGPAPPK